jgi:hypothetical protein
MEIEAKFLQGLYLKARLSFNKCILNPGNSYLKDEVNGKLDEIIISEDFVRVQFFSNNPKKFLIEVKLQLITQDNLVIGRYFYYEDENKVPVDDSLIFD